MNSDARLTQYRYDASQWGRKHPHGSLKNPTWRDMRRFKRSPFARRFANSYSDGHKQLRLLKDMSDVGTDDASDILGLRHTGWYASPEYQEDLITGYVVRMRTARGTLYIPATRCDGWDGITWYLGHAGLVPRGADADAHDAAKRSAAKVADALAEREAEAEAEAAAEYLAREAQAEAADAVAEQEDWERVA